jgi:hypothetical protein
MIPRTARGRVVIISGMPFGVTKQEKRILACLALLIVLGLIGLAIL